MNKKVIIILVMALLMAGNAYAVVFSYVPRITLYGNTTSSIDASLNIENPMDSIISVSVSHGGQSDVKFKGSTEFTMMPTETRIINFTVYPKVAGTREEYIYYAVEGNNTTSAVFQATMTLVITGNNVTTTNITSTENITTGTTSSTTGNETTTDVIPTLLLLAAISVVIIIIVAVILKRRHDNNEYKVPTN